MEAFTGGVSPTTTFINGVAVVQYPFKGGLTYVFYWNSSGTLSFLHGNKISGGVNSYSDKSITVGSSTVSNNSNNSPLAAALTSDGNIHVFYADNKASRLLTEIIYNPNTNTWSTGTLSTLQLLVHDESGIGASNEPILKVVFQSKGQSSSITEAWWDPSGPQWNSMVIS
ncbi:uncharacterized protein BDR25DRAFT_308289 [Lindgomyces ingoldianus]|uniref:Uncharacterized protein n=1 Tax=Lindgomyces ingoldianus TaxID=673940 RepID=A0ACB6Q8C9_9PLEO|nr:uncharacterized protein BDR25DRAFT_308289 [Lindgomyces ingoldianus]KAF2462470.1 hypothetical protein BDR25DRAFT_308289 [Lindgomyces ingoldianus]